MKKIILVLIVFMSIIFLSSKVYANANDVEGLSTVSDSKLAMFHGNILENPNLRYSSIDTTISGWNLTATHNQNASGTKHYDVNIDPNEIANEQGFRIVETTAKIPNFDNYRVGLDNHIETDENTNKESGYTTPGNLKTRISYVSGRTIGGNGTTFDAFFQYLQYLSGLDNRTYVARVEYETQNSSQTNRIGLYLYQGARPGTNVNDGLNKNYNFNRSVEGNTNILTTSLNITNNVGDQGKLTFNMRVHPTQSNEPESTFIIKRALLMTKEDYDIQVAVNNIFVDNEHSDVKFETKEAYENRIVAINNQNNNLISEEVKEYVARELARAAAQRKIYDDLYTDIDNMYQNSEKTIVLDTVTNQMIEDIKVRINQTKNTSFQNELRDKLQHVEIIKKKQDSKKQLEDRALVIKQKIDSYENLDDVEKQELKDRVEQTLINEKEIIDNKQTISEIDDALNIGVMNLEKDYLDSSKQNAKNRIDEKVGELREDGVLTDKFSTLIINSKVKIDDQTTVENVEIELAKLLEKLELEAHKENQIDELKKYYNEKKDNINKMTDVLEKEEYIRRIDEKLEEGITNINSDENKSNVDNSLNDAKAEIDKIYIEAKISDIKEKITKKQGSTKTEIELIPELTRKEYFKDLVDQVVLEGFVELENATSENQIEVISKNIEDNIDDILNRAKADAEATVQSEIERFLNDLEKRKNNIITAIEGFEKINDNKKNLYIDEINEIYNVARTKLTSIEIDATTTIDEAQGIYDDAVRDLNLKYNEANLENEKNKGKAEIEAEANINKNRIAELNLTDEDKIKYNNLIDGVRNTGIDAIDNSTQISEVRSAETTADIEYEKVMLEAYQVSATKSINDAKENYENKIRGLEGLTEQEKDDLVNDGASYANSSIETILDSKVRSEIIEIRNSADIHYEDKFKLAEELSKDRVNSKKELDEWVKELIGDQMLTDDLQIILDEYKSKINEEIEKEEFIKIVSEGRNKIEQNVLENVKLKQEEFINSLESSLTEPISDEVKELILTGSKKINGKNYNDENVIMRIKDETNLEVLKQRSKESIDLYVDTRVTKIDDELQEIINQGISDIDAATEDRTVITRTNTTRDEINDYLNREVTKVQSNVQQVLDDYAGLAKSELVNVIIEKAVEEINSINYNNDEEVTRIIEEAKLKIKKQKAKEYLDDYLEEQFGTDIPEDLTPELEAIKDNIDNAETEELVDEEIKKGKEAIDNTKTREINAIKEKAKEEMESVAKDPNDPKTIELINEYLEKITEENYKNTESIQQIVNDGKEAIINKDLEELKETVRKELENVAVYKDLRKEDIDDAVNQITKDNYKNTEEIEQIINDGKEIIINKDLEDAKVEVREELGEHAINKEDQETKQIIEEKIAEVTKDNYKDLANIISDGKEAITDLEVKRKQAEIKEKLEEYANDPTNEITKNIIQEEIERITKDNYKNDEEITKITEEAKARIKESEVEEVRNRVREELEAHAKRVISDAVEKIIAGQVGQVDVDNYLSLSTITIIVEEGKLLINGQELIDTQNDVRTKLNKIIDRMVTDEMEEIINEQVSKVTTENYGNEEAINSIVNEGEEKLNHVLLVDDRNKAKKEVIDKYNELVDSGKYNNNGLEKLKEIYEDAIKKIDVASNGEEAFSIRDQAIKELEEVEKDRFYGWLITALLVLILIELIIIILKRKSNKQKRLNALTLPFLFFVVNGTIGRAIVIILIIIILILLVYIIYLFVDTKKKQKGIEKKVVHHYVKETEVIKEEKPKEIIEEVKETEEKDVLELDEQGLYIRYNYSFDARMHQAPIESQERFSEIKNYILSYEGVSLRKSWRNERFMYQGKPIAKFWIHGNILDAYLNLNYDELADTKYEVEDLRGKRLHENTPVLYKVSGPRNLEYLKELIDMYMQSVGGIRNKDYKNINYTVKYISKKDLLNEGLIKVNKTK